MPEIFRCSVCDAVISETLAFRTAKDYEKSLCLGCEAKHTGAWFSAQPAAPPRIVEDKRGESIPLAGIPVEGCFVAVLIPMSALDPTARAKLMGEIGRVV